jgi:hypothetical protein
MPFAEDRRGAVARDVRKKYVPVKPPACERNKQIAGLRLA